MACVKIYLCSNPDDSVTERKVLRENVFSKIRDHCRRKHGVDFRVIDPYEEPSPDKWPTQQVRLKLIEDCRQNSLGPFFVSLVGEQYGTACLPEQVEFSEFLRVLRVCQEMGYSSEVLEKCYRRDENTIPPSFCLLTRHKYYKYHKSQSGQLSVDNGWDDVVTKARKTLHDVITQCVLEGSIDQEKAQKYFWSRLENDLHFALDGLSGTDTKRCLCYVYKPDTNGGQTRKCNVPHPEHQDQLSRLSQLCENYLPNLVRTQQILICTSTNRGKSDDKQRYAEELSHQIYLDLIGLIDQLILKKVQIHDSSSQQKNLSTLYRIEREEVSHIKAYLEQDTKYPFILIGGPCTGKSVLLAHCASQIQTWMKDQNPVVVAHFLDSNSTLKQILSDTCQQIALGHGQQFDTCLKDVSQLKETFNNLLTTNSHSLNHLILIMDGLDQIPDRNRPLDLTWLPKKLPSNVKLLISSTPTKSGFLSALKAYYPESSLIFDLKPLTSKQCSQMLTTLLLACRRKITSGQQMYVNQAFKRCDLPLYVDLLYRQVCLWNSDLEIMPDVLVPGIHTNIDRFLDHLEEKHGKLIVARSLEYLTLSRFGLTEVELTDILSCDDEVLLSFLPSDNYTPYKLRVPEVVIERLLLDLKGFLILQNISGTQTLSWVSRHFVLVIRKRYLCLDNQQKSHSLIANYFSGRWACGTAKPLLITASSRQNIMPKIYSDRQVPGQPWTFQPFMSTMTTSGSPECVYPNLRKLQELPFHLLKSECIEEFHRVMMSQEFLNAMFCAKLVDEMVFWLEKSCQIVFSRELRLLISILKTSTCMLRNCSTDFALVIQAKLFPFFKVLPKLKKYVNHKGHDGTIGCHGVIMVLCPTTSVPATHWTFPVGEESPITRAAVSQSGYVVMIQNNGSAWIWNGSDLEGNKITQSAELQFKDVRCSENVFILLTKSGNLLSLDTSVLSYLQPLHTQHMEQPLESITGVSMVSGKMFVFSKESSSISVFSEGTEVHPVHCSNGVTCMTSCDGQILYCGQNEGTVSIFDLQSGDCSASFNSSLGTALFNIIDYKKQETITCIDCTGSVFVWDLKNIKKPVFITKRQSSNKEEVLSVDHTESDLLICKSQQIQMIYGHLLAAEEQFNAPKGKTFVQAILDHDAHFIIALMKNCPFPLVWNWVSGQCLLNLDIRSGQGLKLVKYRDTYLTAVTSRGIVSWDMDFISVAASTPKSGRRVVKVIVEPDEEHFYTSDGSELVWKWMVLGGKVEGHMLHNGPVENLTLSADSVHIVSIASGDIYVWNTSTHENIHRIHSSQASRVLITPNCNFAVSLSETGLSKVWKLCNGHLICSIYHHLKDAVITPESTFLLGINEGILLAVSLWSGYISKWFSYSDWTSVAAFHMLSDYPDYVMVFTNSGALYSWRLTDDTVCHQFQFPEGFGYPPQLFKISSDGCYGIISVVGAKINIFDLCQGKLCSLKAEGPVCQPFVDFLGKYIVYICSLDLKCQNYSCDLHTKQILVIIRVTDGKMVDKFYLCKNVTALTLSKTLCVYIGFEDGAVGVYAIHDTDVGYANANAKRQATELICPFDEPVVWLPLPAPSLTWAKLI